MSTLSGSSESGATGKRKVDDVCWSHEILGGVTDVLSSTPQDSFEHKEDKTIKPFNDLKRSRQYKIKKRLKDQLLEAFEKYSMDDDKCIEFLEYTKKHFTKTRNAKSNSVIEDQLSALDVPNRQVLVRLLTHREDAINEDILDIFPALRAKSLLYMEIKERKSREDMIDLQFVSDFMHDYCRYLCFLLLTLSITIILIFLCVYFFINMCLLE